MCLYIYIYAICCKPRLSLVSDTYTSPDRGDDDDEFANAEKKRSQGGIEADEEECFGVFDARKTRPSACNALVQSVGSIGVARDALAAIVDRNAVSRFM